MCDFKPGDEVVRVGCSPEDAYPGQKVTKAGPAFGVVYVVERIWAQGSGVALSLVGFDGPPNGYDVRAFRKVQRRDLSAWLETATDFEEPKRAPAKKERVA